MRGFPLTIGIAGHRDIATGVSEEITRGVTDVLRRSRQVYRDVPLVVLTALAQGCDQLAAHAAHNVEGVSVVAVLPMPVQEYRRDFTGSEDRARFDEMLRTADARVIVSDYWPDREQLVPRLGEPEIRDLAYQRGARFISLHSQVLLAVWDGQEPELIGGTADTVYHRVQGLEGISAAHHVDFPVGRPPETTLHIPVRRAGRDTPALLMSGEVGSNGVWSLTGGTTCERWVPGEDDPLIHACEELNREVAASGQHSAREVDRLMVAADTLAARLQRTFRRTAASILALSLMGLVLISLVFNVTALWLLVMSALSVSAVSFLWWRLAHSRSKQRFQQFRVLAEGARIQQVWTNVGSARSIADVYLTHQPEVRWIRTLLRTAWLLDESQTADAKSDPTVNADQAYRSAHDWLSGQTAYFLGDRQREGALRRNQSKANMLKRIIVVGIVLAVAGVVPAVLDSISAIDLPAWVSVVGQGMWALGLGVAAASAAYSELLAFRDVSRRYVQSVEIFGYGLVRLQRVRSRADSAQRISQTRRIVEDVGTEALQETSAWFATSYERKVRPV